MLFSLVLIVEFDKVETVLEKLEGKYPEKVAADKLLDQLDIKKHKLEPIRDYLLDRGYIEFHGIGKSDSLAITTEGIDFLREESRAKTQQFHNQIHFVATVVIAIFTMVYAFGVIADHSHDLNKVAGSKFECPELDRGKDDISFKFSNSGGSSGAVLWNIETKNVSVEPQIDYYELDGGINVGEDQIIEREFEFESKDNVASAKVEFTARKEAVWPLGSFGISVPMYDEICLYEEGEGGYLSLKNAKDKN